MKWEPWETYKEEVPVLAIDMPPCSDCQYWKPQRIYINLSTGVQFDGVKLCHANDMHNDFSCYKERVNNV